jgi:hypothetical protein
MLSQKQNSGPVRNPYSKVDCESGTIGLQVELGYRFVPNSKMSNLKELLKTDSESCRCNACMYYLLAQKVLVLYLNLNQCYDYDFFMIHQRLNLSYKI